MTAPPNASPIGPMKVDIKALIAVFLGVALGALDTSIANTALPAISADLNTSAAASVWIVNAYQLAVVAGLFPLAALGDLVGARRVFLWGIAVFTVASLGCALAPDLLWLSLARGVQGLGAAGVMSVNIALIRILYPAARLGRGVGLNAFIVGSSFTLGPSVASLILSVANWPIPCRKRTKSTQSRQYFLPSVSGRLSTALVLRRSCRDGRTSFCLWWLPRCRAAGWWFAKGGMPSPCCQLICSGFRYSNSLP